MPGTVIGKQMNNGYPGTYSRNGDCVIESRQINPTDSAGPGFGRAVLLVQNNTGGFFVDVAVAVAGANTPVMTQGANYSFAGFAVREVMTQIATYTPAQPLTPLIQTYTPGQQCDVLVRGTMTIKVTDPQAGGYKANQSVFLRISTNGSFPTAAVGDVETIADGAHTIQLTNVFMTTGVADANSVVEVTIIGRNVS